MGSIATALVRVGVGRSDVHRARGAGPLRLLTPRAAGNAAWIVTSSLGGGLVDGDDVTLELEVDDGATCVLATQSSTKAYRGRTTQAVRARIGEGAAAIIVPDPLVPYRDARVVSKTRVELAATGSLVLVDTLTAGRVAHGERWASERIDSTLLVVRDRVLLHDRVVLDRAHGDVAAKMQRFAAIATCILLGPRVAAQARDVLAAIAALPVRDPQLAIAASPLAEGCVVRIASTSTERIVAATRVHLGNACAELGEDPWARKW